MNTSLSTLAKDFSHRQCFVLQRVFERWMRSPRAGAAERQSQITGPMDDANVVSLTSRWDATVTRGQMQIAVVRELQKAPR